MYIQLRTVTAVFYDGFEFKWGCDKCLTDEEAYDALPMEHLLTLIRQHGTFVKFK
jgi:hypothetical protein